MSWCCGSNRSKGVQWEAINPPLTSSAYPPHRPPQLISEVKKASVSHRCCCMNKSSSPGSEEDLCLDSRRNELRRLWSRFSRGTWSPLLTGGKGWGNRKEGDQQQHVKEELLAPVARVLQTTLSWQKYGIIYIQPER